MCCIVEPPFVSYCMIVEEHPRQEEQCTTLPATMMMETEDIEEPQEAGLFDEFVRTYEKESKNTMRAPRAVSRIGPISKFSVPKVGAGKTPDQKE